MPLTIRELRKIIAESNLPDDTIVFVSCGDFDNEAANARGGFYHWADDSVVLKEDWEKDFPDDEYLGDDSFVIWT